MPISNDRRRIWEPAGHSQTMQPPIVAVSVAGFTCIVSLDGVFAGSHASSESSHCDSVSHVPSSSSQGASVLPVVSRTSRQLPAAVRRTRLASARLWASRAAARSAAACIAAPATSIAVNTAACANARWACEPPHPDWSRLTTTIAKAYVRRMIRYRVARTGPSFVCRTTYEMPSRRRPLHRPKSRAVEGNVNGR